MGVITHFGVSIKRVCRLALGVGLWMTLGACGTSTGGEAGGADVAGTGIAIGGSVSKGHVARADVNLYAIQADGTRGSMVAGPFTTDPQGNWTGTRPLGSSGPFELVATGGDYTDESRGIMVSIPADAEMTGILNAATIVGAITPVSDAMRRAAVQFVAGGATPLSAVTQTRADALSAFGFDPYTVRPDDTGSLPEQRYAALVGGVSRLTDPAVNGALAGFSATPPFELVTWVMEDLTDGVLDGAANGTVLTTIVATGAGTQATPPALDGTGIGALLDAANAYAQATPALAGVSLDAAAQLQFTTPGSTGGAGGGTGGTTPDTGTPSEACKTVVPAGVPTLFATRAGDFALAIVRSTDLNYPLGSGRTEYVFRVCPDGQIAVLDGGAATELYTQTWDGLDVDQALDVSGTHTLLLHKDTGVTVFGETVQITFPAAGSSDFIEGRLALESAAEGVVFSSDPSIRGLAAPTEWSVLVGSHVMEKVATVLGSAEIYVVTITAGGRVSFGPQGKAATDSYVWDGLHTDRVTVIDVTVPRYQFRVQEGPTGFNRVIDYDAASGGIIRMTPPIIAGAEGGAGNFGALTIGGSTPAGADFSPGRPTVNTLGGVSTHQWIQRDPGILRNTLAVMVDDATGDVTTVTLSTVEGLEGSASVVLTTATVADCPVAQCAYDAAAGQVTFTDATLDPGAVLTGTLDVSVP